MNRFISRDIIPINELRYYQQHALLPHCLDPIYIRKFMLMNGGNLFESYLDILVSELGVLESC